MHGQIGPGEIMGQGLRDPKTAGLIERITVLEEARYSQRFPAGRWSDVTVTLLDGRALASGEVNARGGPEAPLDLSEVEAKFHVMAQALPEPRRNALWNMRAELLQPGTLFKNLAQLVRASIDDTHA